MGVLCREETGVVACGGLRIRGRSIRGGEERDQGQAKARFEMIEHPYR